MDRHPIFPEYYYADAHLYDAQARVHAATMRGGVFQPSNLTPGRELYTRWVACLYYLAGPCPLLPMLINGVLAGAAILLWHRIVLSASRDNGPPGRRVAFWAVLFLAFWPTHVFYTSQNLKEAMMLSALAAAFLSIAGRRDSNEKSWIVFSRIAAGGAALFFCGLLRAHILPLAAAALLGGEVWRFLTVRRPEARRVGALVFLGVIGVVVLFQVVSPLIFNRLKSYGPDASVPFVRDLTQSSGNVRPYSQWSAAWLTDFRKIRQQRDQQWALRKEARQIQTQIFPDAEFRDWQDICFFLPKAAFYVLFMPLPGLYDMSENLGRWLASLENLALLTMFIAALSGLRRRWNWAMAGPCALFFALMWLASALTEVDLGSATRHRLIYFPFLLPFTAVQASAFWDWLREHIRERVG